MEEEYHLLNRRRMVLFGIILASSCAILSYQSATFNTFFESFITGVYGITDPSQKRQISGNLNLLFLLGGMCGSFGGHTIVNRIGQRRSLLLLSLGWITVCLLYSIPGLYFIYVLRFLGGCLAGISLILPMLVLNQIFPPNMRRTFTNMWYAIGMSSSTFAYMLGSLGGTNYWRLVFWFPLFLEVPKVLLLFFYFGEIESPDWIFEQYANRNMIYNVFSHIYDKEFALQKTEEFLESKKSQVDQNKSTVTLGDLVSPAYRKQFSVSLVIMTTNHLTGIAMLSYYSRTIFDELSLPFTTLLTFMMGIVNFAAAVLVTKIANKYGRKSFIVGGLVCCGCGFFLLLHGIMFQIGFLAVLGVYIFTFSYGVGPGGSGAGYISEIVPPLGYSVSMGLSWALSCFVGKFSLIIVAHFGIFQVFLGCMTFCFIHATIVAGFGVETKGNSFEEIRKKFRNKLFFD